jgi:NADP-dependent 3-hydroxy acid dehydrogenase YdfG
VDAYMLMAYVAEQSGDFMLSQSCLEKVALLQSAYPNIFYKLGILTNTHFKNQKRKALRYFKEAVANDSSNADAYYQIALLESDQNTDFDTIIGYLNQAIEHDPQHGKAAIELAKAYYEIGNRERAFHFYTQACDIAPVFKTKLNDEIFKYEAPVPEPEPPQLNDNGITVLVTGATSGIGKATAEIFAKNGYRLILTGRRNDRLEHVKTVFEEAYKNKIHILNFDVRDLESVKQTIENLDEEWKNVDILINNAGLASGLAPIHEGDIEDWEAMIDTNIKGLLYMTRAVAPHMVERQKGHIINISSIAGKEIYPNGNVYIASKHAVDALTRSMRVDLYKHNIRVSQVAPGMVEETEFALVRFHGDTEKAKIYEDIQPLKASDVAETIYFIATRPEYVNIQDIVMMGTQQANAVFFDRSGRKDK